MPWRVRLVGSVGLTWLALATPGNLSAESIPDQYRQNGFAIGCQAYTFNRYSVFEAIEKTAEAGGKVIEFFPGQKLSQDEPRSVGTTTPPTRSSPRSRPSSRNTRSRR